MSLATSVMGTLLQRNLSLLHITYIFGATATNLNHLLVESAFRGMGTTNLGAHGLTLNYLHRAC